MHVDMWTLFCRGIFIQVQESRPAEIRGLQVMSMPCIHSYPLTVITGNVYLTQYVLIMHVIFSFLPFAFSTLYLNIHDIVFQLIYMYDVVFQQIYMYTYHVPTRAKSIRSQWRCCLCWRWTCDQMDRGKILLINFLSWKKL